MRTPLLGFLAVSMLLLPLFSLCRAHHLAASVWGDAEARFSKIQHDKFEKKIFFLKQLSQHWKQPEDLRPLTFNLAGIKQEPAHLLFMTRSVGSVSLPFLLRIHSTAPTVVRVTSYTLFFFFFAESLRQWKKVRNVSPSRWQEEHRQRLKLPSQNTLLSRIAESLHCRR